jgi:hypothetical protein
VVTGGDSQPVTTPNVTTRWLAAVTLRLGGAATVWAVVAAMGLPALLFAPWLLTAPAGEDASGGPPAGDSERAAGGPESGAPRSTRESR